MRCGAGINLLTYVLLIKKSNHSVKTLTTCYKVSAVCSHCYLPAERFNHLLSQEQILPIPSYPQMQVTKLTPVHCFLCGPLT